MNDGCVHCVRAAADVLTYGGGDARCSSCAARRIANSPAVFKALHENAPGDLQGTIASTFKDYEAGRRAVWEWIERYQAARSNPK